MYQISLFDGENKFENDKPIRLIELFGGYGSQALALKYLGIPFEHWILSEWAVKSIQAYKDMHCAENDFDYSCECTVEEVREWLYGKISADYNTPMTEQQINRLSEKQVRTIYNNMQATHNLGSITQIKAEDLAVVDTDKYCYIMTYSFPCQDLSLAGKGKGMSKDSGTRSGLLWEVERLLTEMTERPQVLLMENVPQVVNDNFMQWIMFLEKLGYKNYWQLINAKDQCIPQNRNRCFMVSMLGDYYYTFPKSQKPTVRLKDFLDKKVDEKYYLSDKALKYINKRIDKYTQICDDETEYAKSAITAVGNQNWTGNFIKTSSEMEEIKREPIIYDDYNGRIRADQDCIGTLTTNCGNDALRNGVKIIESIIVDEIYNNREPRIYHDNCPTLRAERDGLKVIESAYRLRKLTPIECGRLMGVKSEDCERLAKNQSISSQYHLYGDSIVTTCLMAILGELFSVSDYESKINELVEELRQ